MIFTLVLQDVDRSLPRTVDLRALEVTASRRLGPDDGSCIPAGPGRLFAGEHPRPYSQNPMHRGDAQPFGHFARLNPAAVPAPITAERGIDDHEEDQSDFG